MNTFNNINFISYKVKKFSLQEPDKDISLDQNDFGFGIQTSVGLSEEDSQIQILQEFSIYYEVPKDSDNRIELLQLEVEAEFGNIDVTSFEKRSDGRPKIPDILLRILVGLTASTTRGIIIAKTAGTSMKEIILPIIDPADMVTPEVEEEG